MSPNAYRLATISLVATLCAALAWTAAVPDRRVPPNHPASTAAPVRAAPSTPDLRPDIDALYEGQAALADQIDALAGALPVASDAPAQGTQAQADPAQDIAATTALLDRMLGDEGRDPDWSDAAEHALDGAVQASGLDRFGDARVACARSVCRVDVALRDDIDPMIAADAADRTHAWAGTTMALVHTDRPARAIVYVAREGLDLPHSW